MQVSRRSPPLKINQTHFHSELDVDHNPSHVARADRKKLIAKNERQRKGNDARAQATLSERDARKQDIEKTLAATRISTASMGKFDKKLDGEKKLRGIKRKVSYGSFYALINLRY